MTPFRFIRLHDQNGKTEVLVNVEQIVLIRDMRSDPAAKNSGMFKWTQIATTSRSIDVLETEEEIVAKIALLQ